MNILDVQSKRISSNSWILFGMATINLATLVWKVWNYGSASIFLEDNTRRDPVGQFKYDGVRRPTFLFYFIEVAYSQSRRDRGKDLPKLADQYITGTSGNIKAALGISLDYRSTK